MRTTVAPQRQSTHLNSIETRMAKASIAIKSSETSDADGLSNGAVSLVFESLAEIGMSDKEAAYTMALDPAQLSRIKSGQARLPFDAMWRLPVHFWSDFAKRVSEAKGLSETSQRELRVARIKELFGLLIAEAM